MTESQLRALVIDDERPARVALRELLEQHSQVQIVGEADSVSTAVNLCYQVHPDLLFLDIQMEDGTGFDVLSKLSAIPATIFITAYQEFAIRAFQVNAIHYLLKPVSPHELAHALERIKHKQPALFNGQLKLDDIVTLRSDGGFQIAYVSEISGIEGKENYVLVHLSNGGARMVRSSMGEWESALPRHRFARPHRSLIVNLQKVIKVTRKGRDEFHVEITGFREPFILGRRAAANLQKLIEEPNLL